MKLALQGVSVIFASGDSGVANRYNSGYNNSCLNTEYGYVETEGTRFSPSFPANCPYVSSNHVLLWPTLINRRLQQLAQQHCSIPLSTAASKQLPLPEASYLTIRAAASPASFHVHPGSLMRFPSISPNTLPSMASRYSTLLVVHFPTFQLLDLI